VRAARRFTQPCRGDVDAVLLFGLSIIITVLPGGAFWVLFKGRCAGGSALPLPGG
jgi:hypothetical protein